MVDIQIDLIEHQKAKKLREKNISIISVFDSKYRIGFEIPTPASPRFYYEWFGSLTRFSSFFSL